MITADFKQTCAFHIVVDGFVFSLFTVVVHMNTLLQCMQHLLAPGKCPGARSDFQRAQAFHPPANAMRDWPISLDNLVCS
jgi:hypothetical protein